MPEPTATWRGLLSSLLCTGKHLMGREFPARVTMILGKVRTAVCGGRAERLGAQSSEMERSSSGSATH